MKTLITPRVRTRTSCSTVVTMAVPNTIGTSGRVLVGRQKTIIDGGMTAGVMAIISCFFPVGPISDSV